MFDARKCLTLGLRIVVVTAAVLLLLGLTHSSWSSFSWTRDRPLQTDGERRQGDLAGQHHDSDFDVGGGRHSADDRDSKALLEKAYVLADADQPKLQQFLGKRPASDLYLDTRHVQSICGAPEKWRDTNACLQYLQHNETDYLRVDQSAKCDRSKPVIYHTYWRGPLTWRVGLALQSWLYTQNLGCSEIHIWLDTDYDPTAELKARASPVLKPFLPLVDDLIRLRRWTYPTSIRIPKHLQQGQIEFDLEDRVHFKPNLIPVGPVAVSDSVRFLILHEEGGLYIDMDTLFLRDLRPLLIAPGASFAERWGGHEGDWQYNTAYLRLEPRSNLSATIVQASIRMGMNFHPSVVGKMLQATGRTAELLMFETGLFDPLWTEFDHDRTGDCCVPCLPTYKHFFDAQQNSHEWSTFQGERVHFDGLEVPTNRTLASFYRGAYTYHIHNSWSRPCEPGSWCWVAKKSYEGFLSGTRHNPYGEWWKDTGLPKLDTSTPVAAVL